MTRTLRFAPVILALSLLTSTHMLAQFTASSNTQTSAAARLPAALVGSWRMTKLEFGGPDNYRTVAYSGQIIFTSTGNVAVQAMNPDTSAPDTPYTVKGVLAS